MLILEKYFESLTPEQTNRFAQLESLYNLWNQQINVISRKDMENLYVHHVLHSLSIAKIIRFKPGAVIVDAGTGGGFPGIPLSIMFPGSRFILVDSIAKKIKVVDAVIRELQLTNCETRNLRLEDLHDKADFVVSRAVTEIPRLYGWVKKNLIPGGSHELKNGLITLKGGDLSEELKPMGNRYKIYDLSDYFSEPFFETKKMVYIPL
jgi:16S rRNA (guanine527-N7)-methyltransferase